MTIRGIAAALALALCAAGPATAQFMPCPNANVVWFYTQELPDPHARGSDWSRLCISDTTQIGKLFYDGPGANAKVIEQKNLWPPSWGARDTPAQGDQPAESQALHIGGQSTPLRNKESAW